MTSFRRISELTLALGLVAGTFGCGNGADGPDAYGNFEADVVRVAAEVGGRLVAFQVDEGQRLSAGADVAAVDATPIELELAQIDANRAATESRRASVEAQAKVLETQLRLALAEQERVEQLAADQAATPQQRDRAASEVAVLRARMAEARTQLATIADEVAAIAAGRQRVEDRRERAKIKNPIDGTVLTTFVEAHEVVSAGQPLYEVADLDELELRAYASGAQLPQLRLGQSVQVEIDAPGGGTQRRPGVVRWIASSAEFTPSTLQTKEERVDLVYAFRVAVANADGVLKIGMPAEVYFGGEG